MLLSPEFHSLYVLHFKLRKENLFLKKRISSNILVHLSFYHWASPFPLSKLFLVCEQVSSILESIWLFVRIAMFKSYAEWLSWWVKILSCLCAFVWLGKPSECFVGLFRANISARPFQLYPNVFAKFSNPKFKFLMKFIKDSLCNSEIWLHFKRNCVCNL